MKKLITFVVCFAMALSAVASTGFKTTSVNELVTGHQGKIDGKALAFLKSNPESFHKEFKYKKLDDNRYLLKANSKTVMIERVSDNIIKINDYPVVIKKGDSPQLIVKKINQAILGTESQFTSLESLFINKAHASSFTIAYWAYALTILVAGWVGYLIAENKLFKKKVKKDAAVQAQQTQAAANAPVAPHPDVQSTGTTATGSTNPNNPNFNYNPNRPSNTAF